MSRAIAHHPNEVTLLGFAAGTLSEPLAAVVAAHAALCTRCRAEIADMELIGAALLGVPISEAERGPAVRIPARRTGAVPKPIALAVSALPAPIAAAYGLTYETIPWSWLAPGVMHYRLALSPSSKGDLRLLKVAAGVQLPEHGHSGSELTLVLEGAFRDVTGHYQRGDVQDADVELEHHPFADPETGCVCIIASEGPARFKGLVGRLLQPWTRM
jgi:putative transcriptional regulator